MASASLSRRCLLFDRYNNFGAIRLHPDTAGAYASVVGRQPPPGRRFVAAIHSIALLLEPPLRTPHIGGKRSQFRLELLRPFVRIIWHCATFSCVVDATSYSPGYGHCGVLGSKRNAQRGDGRDLHKFRDVGGVVTTNWRRARRSRSASLRAHSIHVRDAVL